MPEPNGNRGQENTSSFRAAATNQTVAFLVIWLLSAAAIIIGVEAQIGRYSRGVVFTSALLSAFVIQLALLWIPGFPALRSVTNRLGRWKGTLIIGAALLLPYVIYGAGTGAWSLFPALKLITLTLIVLGTYLWFPPQKQSLSWQDAAVMVVIAAPVYLGWYKDIWPVPVYLDPMTRLFVVALVAFALLSVRPLQGVGYEWRLKAGDWLEGGKQLILYSAVGIPLGYAMRFIAWHPRRTGIVPIAASFGGIFLFIAVAEELFFRGMLQNLLEKTMANKYAARAVASAIFGLSHIYHGFPNWRYVIMAAIAGWFYGTAWHSRRNIVAACVVHAGVDTIWRHFLTA
jgi:membrane protease YdiL (CAAX protease family)